MRADRPGVRTSTVPRLRSIAILGGVVLCVAALAPARAQTTLANPAADQTELFRLPDAATVFGPLKADPRAPGRFRRAAPARSDGGATRVGEVQVYGNPPASGAGATGYDSTNAIRRRARAAIKPKPGVSLPVRPLPGVVPEPAVATVPTRPS